MIISKIFLILRYLTFFI